MSSDDSLLDKLGYFAGIREKDTFFLVLVGAWRYPDYIELFPAEAEHRKNIAINFAGSDLDPLFSHLSDLNPGQLQPDQQPCVQGN